MKHTLPFALSSLLALCAGPVLAQGLQPQLSATVGSGVNESYLVLDFETSTSQTPDASYAFGYLYSPSSTGAEPNGLEMIQALQSANIGFDYTATTYSFGTAIDSFSYNDLSEGGFQSNGYWSYYTSTNGVFGQSSNVGAGVPVTPFAASAVPEDGSAYLLLLALPFGFLATRRRIRA
jgi:hypothetical protein